MSLQNRTLFFGDNLKILEKLPDESFDLIYLDPPFNSNRDYSVIFKEGGDDSDAQLHAFEDTWEWTPETNRLFEVLQESNNPDIAILITSLFEFMRDTPMMAYLVNMTVRLLPLHRVLKSTGSMYLHCDPTASHYLKIILDVIFGKRYFQNEIIWCYEIGARGKSRWARKHDVILFYTKSDKYYFDWKSVATPRKPGTHMRLRTDENGREYQEKTDAKSGKVYRYYVDEGTIPPDWWTGIQQLNREAAERLGYPTQKPEALLERIIKASTDEYFWILDPFCGCGTSVAVAEKLNRRWVGIDISMQAINVIQKRLTEHYPHIKVHIDGIPMDYESAQSLAAKDKFSFQDWAAIIVIYMRLHKKLLLLTILAFLTFTGIAYASSSAFFAQAKKYIDGNCSKKKITDQLALFCYLFNKSQEQDGAIATVNMTLSPIPSEVNSLKTRQSQTEQDIFNLQTTQASQASQISGLTKNINALTTASSSVKQFIAYDGEAQKLGILIGSAEFNGTWTVYNEPLGKIGSIASNNGIIQPFIGAYYTSSDCSGTPYVAGHFFDDYLFRIHQNPNTYAIVNTNAAPSSQQILSFTDNPSDNYVHINQLFDNMIPLTQVPYPYPNQIQAPLHIKYQ